MPPPPSACVVAPSLASGEPDGAPESLLLEHPVANAHAMPETATSAARLPSESLLIVEADSYANGLGWCVKIS
jgi:hypothetical protein